MAKGRASERVAGLDRAVCRGEFVFLRHPTGRDRAAYVRLRESCERHLRPWEPTLGVSHPEHDEVFARVLASADTPDAQRFVVCLRDGGGIIGQVSLNAIQRGAFQSAFLGYWIALDFAGKGLMSRAVALALDHAFGPLRLHRVEANIIPRNAPSIALVRRLEFRFEGLAQRYLRINGRWEDHEHWAITAEEWSKRREDSPGGG
jgi:ribosomal-protein-alanine N-acetyltransferase